MDRYKKQRIAFPCFYKTCYYLFYETTRSTHFYILYLPLIVCRKRSFEFLKPDAMRKKIALSIILIALFLQTKSQSNAVEFGINGGMNINSASGASIIKEHNNSLTGFNIGGHLKIKTSDRFGFKAKLQYDQMGWA